MALGYDGKLYFLAFDHRGSFQKKMFGIEGDPTPEETERIADAKHLIFEGMVKATETGGLQDDQVGVLVDEQFGGTVPAEAIFSGSAVVDYGWSAARDVRTEDIASTIYSALGIDYTTVRHDDPLGRGFEYVPEAKDGKYQPIEELW